MNSRRRLILVSLLAAGATRCNVDEFNSRFYAALCTMEVACGDMPDRPTCLASLQLDTTDVQTLKADIASGKVHYDSAKAEACLEYWERLYGSACTQTAMAANNRALLWRGADGGVLLAPPSLGFRLNDIDCPFGG